MDLNKGNIKKILAIITFAALLFVGLEHFTPVSQFLVKLFGLIFPFLLGGCIAFILNVPMRAIEKTFFTPDFGKRVKSFFHELKKKIRPAKSRGNSVQTPVSPADRRQTGPDETADAAEDRPLTAKRGAVPGHAETAADAGTAAAPSPDAPGDPAAVREKAEQGEENQVDKILRHTFSHFPRRAPHTRGELILDRIKRPCSLVLTLFLVCGVLFAVSFLIIPELGHSFEVIGDNIPGFIDRVNHTINDLMLAYPDIADQIMNIQLDWEQMGKNLLKLVQDSGGDFVTSTLGVATSIVGGVVNFVLGLVFAIYVLLQKENLARQVKQVFYAFLPEKLVKKILYILSLSSATFSRFLSGQCLEAFILGLMFFICMTILKFPYALMISVLIALTALIPIFGAFIGCIVGAFLILIESPVQALWFVVLFLILQQVEGNLIYPHVVGGSIGLPSLWVLVAVTIGGSTMGIAGMLLFIPLCSVLYVLIRAEVFKRLRQKHISPKKWKKQT